MAYIPHTDDERRAMLAAIGVGRLDDLFDAVPADVRFPDLDLPDPISELEVMEELQTLAEANLDTRHFACFLGAGAYNHFIPAAVDQILRRGEFYTAYTPYQPEISQGTLQAIFEYQSLVCNLTGMDVSNASHYDGATALAEAVILALNHHRGKRRKVVLSPAVHPQFRQVVRTYTQGMGLTVLGDEACCNGPADLAKLIDANTALVAVQYPDFFGHIVDFTELAETAHAAGALLCVAVNPLALGMLQPPASFGADVVVGEGQPLGIPLSYGGPYLGIFTTRNEFVRKMAGRLVGETVDSRGQRGYVLTLTPREQHIRREKATSNICTNQGLMALASAVYLSLMGKAGLRQVAELCYHKAQYAAGAIARLDGYRIWNEAPFFNEFVVTCPRPVAEINDLLLSEYDILGGYDLGPSYPELRDHMLLAVTEMNSRQQIDDLVEALEEAAHA
ncbi:MAG: glycine dehydrogenase (aminomethyl-transferring) [Chloroflexi bacterium RBG_13_68_17]|jgi:glycine dehydrogenase subunit 1|nr:MAG: glycine dehydrogenase (aminomethyl-transferring) [Chloroflexi bacterium RBG_13_68_17]